MLHYEGSRRVPASIPHRAGGQGIFTRAEGAGFRNPLYDATPHRGFDFQHSNPAWSPALLPAPADRAPTLGAGFGAGSPLQAPPTATAAELAAGTVTIPYIGLRDLGRPLKLNPGFVMYT